MKARIDPTAPLGELIAAVFDVAARCSTNPREVTALATETVVHMLRHAKTRPS